VHADRSTIAADQLPLLDTFLERQMEKQQALRATVRANSHFSPGEVEDTAIVNNFHLLQAMDNLSLYSCVGFMQSGNLLHPLPTTNGDAKMVEVFPVTPRHFRLKPYPLDEPLLTFTVPARHVAGKVFANSEELQRGFAAAPVQRLTITISA
jgi:hypothetical protein